MKLLPEIPVSVNTLKRILKQMFKHQGSSGTSFLKKTSLIQDSQKSLQQYLSNYVSN